MKLSATTLDYRTLAAISSYIEEIREQGLPPAADSFALDLGQALFNASFEFDHGLAVVTHANGAMCLAPRGSEPAWFAIATATDPVRPSPEHVAALADALGWPAADK